jgi:ketosteroid isomerase-like protein
MSPTDIVNRYTEAFDAGDMSTVESLLADDFRFEGPLMTASSRKEFFEQLAQFEMTARTVVRHQIANGSTVARLFDFELSAPVHTSIPMAEWLEVENGKITASRLFYDPSRFPKP